MSALGMPGTFHETGKWDPKMRSSRSRLSSRLIKHSLYTLQGLSQEVFQKPQELRHIREEPALGSLMPDLEGLPVIRLGLCRGLLRHVHHSLGTRPALVGEKSPSWVLETSVRQAPPPGSPWRIAV